MDRIIDRRELRHLVPYSSSQIYRMERLGRFPRRIAIGPGRVGWLLSEVVKWIEGKKEARK